MRSLRPVLILATLGIGALAFAKPETSPPAPLAAAEAPKAAPADAKKVKVDDPGGVIEVKSKSGTKKVGAERCGGCHEIQMDSWKESGHAKRTPALECESCHGAGSEYKKSATMKDEAKAKAAGLVKPEKDFCSKCHKTGWSDDMLKKVHEHGKVSEGEGEE